MKKMSLQCTQCSSTSLTRISEKSYRCDHCGTMTIIEDTPLPAPARENPSWMRRPRDRRFLLIVTAGIVLVLTMLGIYMVFLRALPPEHRRTGGIKNYYGQKPPSNLHGTFSRISPLEDTIGNIYFVGMYKNTGTAPLMHPRVVITCLSKEGKKIASGMGYARRSFLLPGEETPVQVLVQHPGKYHSISVWDEASPHSPYSDLRRPKLTFRKIAFTKARLLGYEVTGEVVNRDNAAVKTISVICALTGEGGEIVGYGTAYVASPPLGPGEYSPFRLRAFWMKKTPSSYIMDYTCRLADGK